MFQQNKKDPKTVRRDINGVKKKREGQEQHVREESDQDEGCHSEAASHQVENNSK
jgi:hypothetical protein